MTNASSPSILPLSSPLATIDSAGGKGANLSILARAGFPVPGGFILPTTAYRAFLEANRLEETIQRALTDLDATDPAALEKSSDSIRSAFISGSMQDQLKSAIQKAYTDLGRPPVAVRSSATAEDLPDLSFAGQQDTYLNITSDETLIQKVIECWSSLWTARAIGYRLRQGVQQDGMALSVVVQQMVTSEASGVLFTANPLTGLRSEVVIDATLGLGEALVSGLVEPDHYVVNMLNNEIVSKQLGAKGLSIRAARNGGVEQVVENAREQQALSDGQIITLARLGKQVQEHFDSPQDIEWALSAGQLYLLQSRPITSLFPLPAGIPVEPLKAFFSFAAVQGMMDPITPIGQSALKSIFSTGNMLFGMRRTEETQTVLYSAGERLWCNFTTLIKNSFGRKAAKAAFELVEPTIRQAFLQIQDDPRLQPGKPGVSLHARLQLARFVIPLAGNVFLNILSPAARRKFIVQNGENVLRKLEASAGAISGDRYEKLALRADIWGQISDQHLLRTLTLFVSGVAAGMASWNALNMLTSKMNAAADSKTRWNDLVLQITRGMPFNPTTEMDLVLWQMAKTIRRDEPSRQAVCEFSPSELTAHYQNGSLPAPLMDAINGFLKVYGGRGFGEIDLGRTRWAENPTHVFEMLSSFLQIEDESTAPDVVFARGVTSANEAINLLAAAVRKTPHGWFKARLVRFFASRARQLMGIREAPKFFAVRMMWIIHRELLKTGQEFVQAGELSAADDLFYLSFPELMAMASHSERDWRSLIAGRRASYQRELRRRQLPRLLLSDGRAFFEGMAVSAGHNDGAIIGSPVSPGVVEGQVRVVLDPRNANLVPGEIMVCPGTDPSWTPLFMAAAGLVMEVGGMMTHGAVVAREYGIPAAVGVTSATTRLITGQRIRLNGSSGEITLLDETNGQV